MEHHAVLTTCRWLARRTGAELREVGTGKDGLVDLDALAEACTPEVGLVSVMAVNNEIGTVQPLAEVADIVRRNAPGAAFHTDAVQSVAWTDVATLTAPADLVAVSAHKFGGPKGVGALVVRPGTTLRPILHGGGQERDRRSGTPNVAGIVGMAAALGATTQQRSATVARVAALRDRLGDGLLASVAGATETGERRDKVAGLLHLRFAGVASEALVVLLDEAGVAVSAGAACSSGAVEASHVLTSMGLAEDEAASGIRFSLGTTTDAAAVDRALAAVPGAVAQLRD
jgi:cysteine desulfurase